MTRNADKASRYQTVDFDALSDEDIRKFSSSFTNLSDDELLLVFHVLLGVMGARHGPDKVAALLQRVSADADQLASDTPRGGRAGPAN